MVQLPSSGKRPAEPAMAAASAAGATVKLEADEMMHGGEEDGGPLSKRAKAGVQMPAPPPPPPPPPCPRAADPPRSRASRPPWPPPTPDSPVARPESAPIWGDFGELL